MENKKPFVYLCVKGWRNNFDRGGVMYAVQAFLNEFSSKDKTILIIKINACYGIPDINKLINELKPMHRTDFAPIQIITDNIPYEQLVNLYNQCDVFVNPTRAEAFCLPCAEASACNKMVLTTGYGGQTDFIKDGQNGIYVDYKLEEVRHECLYENVFWATPSIEDLRKKMRWCYEHPKEVKDMGIKAGEMIKEFTWDKTAEKIVKLIN